MITGAQIRAARALLGWPVSVLARRSRLTPDAIRRAESVDDDPPVPVGKVYAIQHALEDGGIEFTEEPPGAVLKTAIPPSRRE